MRNHICLGLAPLKLAMVDPITWFWVASQSSILLQWALLYGPSQKKSNILD
jgi:hypothetical protein